MTVELLEGNPIPRTARALAAPGTGRREVTRYYDECEVDYTMLWSLSGSLSMHYGFWAPGTRRVVDAVTNENDAVIAASGVGRGDRVLDAGCGLGGTAIRAARTRGCNVVGITLVPGQAARARRHARAADVAEQVRFAVMDYRQTGLEGGSFDAIWAIESLCYANDTAAFAREARRLLRPGGRLVVADGFVARDLQTPHEAAVLERWLPRWAIARLDSVAAFEEKLARAGFDAVRSVDRSADIRPAARRLWLHSLYGVPASGLGQLLGLRSPAQTANAIGAFRQWQAWRRGIARYAVVVASRPG